MQLFVMKFSTAFGCLFIFKFNTSLETSSQTPSIHFLTLMKDIKLHAYTATWKFYLSQYLTNLMHKICLTIIFISCLYMFRAHVLIIRRSKLHYTAFGIITLIGGRLVQETATYRTTHLFQCDDTRGCVMQF